MSPTPEPGPLPAIASAVPDGLYAPTVDLFEGGAEPAFAACVFSKAVFAEAKLDCGIYG